MKVNTFHFNPISHPPVVASVDAQGRTGPFMLVVGQLKPLRCRVLDEAAWLDKKKWVLADGEPVAAGMQERELVIGWAEWPKVVA